MMKNIKLKAFILAPVALSVMAGTAMAKDVEKGWYVQGNVGQAKSYATQAELRNEVLALGDVGTISPNSQKRRGWRVDGGYRFDNNFSAAITFSDLGFVELGTSTNNAMIREIEAMSGKAVSLVGAYNQPINDWINVHVKGGFSSLEARSNKTTLGRGITKGDNKDWVWGAGMSFDLTENTSLMFDWERYEFEHKIDLLTAGLRYTFGDVEKKKAMPAPVVAPAPAPVVKPQPVPAPTPAPVPSPVVEIKPLKINVYFDNNSSVLTNETKAILDNAGKQLADGNVDNVKVAGFASALGNAAYNQMLSDKRAKNVTKYIQDTWSVESDKISVSASGEEKASDNENNGKDRKVTVRVQFSKEQK
jgi:outer membrane protein OmpA-like peptidoglycan-associated protein